MEFAGGSCPAGAFVGGVGWGGGGGGWLVPRPRKIDQSELKAIAGNTINETKKFKLTLRRAENVAGKGQPAFSHLTKNVFESLLLLRGC